MKLQELIDNRALLFDGGMGSLMAARGVNSACPELANVEHFDAIVGIHSDYIAAGSRVVTTNTFGGNPIKLSRYGLQKRVAELNIAGLEAAKKAAGDKALVAFDMGPTGGVAEPFGELSFEEMYESYAEQVNAVVPGKPDMIIIETMGSLIEMKAAALAARETGIPFITSFTFGGNARTLMGEPPTICALTMANLGAAMIATNCSSGPEQMLPVVKQLLTCGLPVLAQPNAGLPQIIDGKTVYPYDAPTMARLMKPMIDAGLSGIGGCCGTTPEHITEMAKLFPLTPLPMHSPTPVICSSRNMMALSDIPRDIPVVDPEEAYMAEGDVLLYHVEGMAPRDAVEQLNEIISSVTQPLIFDCADDETLTALLRAYPGIPGVVGNHGDLRGLGVYCG